VSTSAPPVPPHPGRSARRRLSIAPAVADPKVEPLLDDGRVFAGTTLYGGRVALRPAISNWRTTAAELDLLVEVVRELGASSV
jgi:hypothetical protein